MSSVPAALHKRVSHAAAAEMLASRDPVLAGLIATAGPIRIGRRTVILSPRGLSHQSDEEVIARLSTVRGIGPWTAQMFLIFRLRRLDVWPTGDFGVRQGYGLAWKVPTPTARELEPLGDPYRPNRTVVAWYCWHAVELYAGAADGDLTR
jgi:3-methyladenine DNA glycosylase/8-oxoguanine DNA glycosylase